MIRRIKSTNPSARPSDGAAPPAQAINAREMDLEHRLKLARQFGNSTMAYSTVCQPGLNYHSSRGGFIAYGSKWGIDYALGDPVVEPDSIDGIVGDFIEGCKRKPCFVQIGKETAAACARRGYYVNQMGVDTWLQLQDYDFRGKEKEPIRYSSNWLRRREFRVEELNFQQLDPKIPAELSRKWRATRTIKNREVGFMNRPLHLEDEPDVRRFFLFDNQDKLHAFVFLDPIYDAGEITGYVTVIKRRDPETTGYAEQGIMKHCVDVLKEEGIRTLRLGLSPLAGMTDQSFKRNSSVHFWWSYAFRSWWVNRYFYNLKGHAAFKRRFRGDEHPVYFASPVFFNDWRIAGLLRLAGVLGGKPDEAGP